MQKKSILLILMACAVPAYGTVSGSASSSEPVAHGAAPTITQAPTEVRLTSARLVDLICLDLFPTGGPEKIYRMSSGKIVNIYYLARGEMHYRPVEGVSNSLVFVKAFEDNLPVTLSMISCLSSNETELDLSLDGIFAAQGTQTGKQMQRAYLVTDREVLYKLHQAWPGPIPLENLLEEVFHACHSRPIGTATLIIAGRPNRTASIGYATLGDCLWSALWFNFGLSGVEPTMMQELSDELMPFFDYMNAQSARLGEQVNGLGTSTQNIVNSPEHSPGEFLKVEPLQDQRLGTSIAFNFNQLPEYKRAEFQRTVATRIAESLYKLVLKTNPVLSSVQELPDQFGG
jgi:hypothetical protein